MVRLLIRGISFKQSDAFHRACYVAMPLYICGFVLLGASFQNHLSVGALIMGWGIAEVAIMINTVAICWCTTFSLQLRQITNSVVLVIIADAYCNDCFPTRQVIFSVFIQLL